jgi:hypothetical protein
MFSMVKGALRESFVTRILKGYGYLFLAQVMCFFIGISIAVFLSKFVILMVFACACTLLITLGLQFNWAYNCAKIDEVLDRQQIKPYDRFMPAKMAGIVGIVPIGLYIALVLSKIGLIPNFYPYYNFISIWQLPFRYFMTDSTAVSDLSVLNMFVYGFLTLLIPATVAVTYILIKRGTDFSAIVYNKDKPE